MHGYEEVQLYANINQTKSALLQTGGVNATIHACCFILVPVSFSSKHFTAILNLLTDINFKKPPQANRRLKLT